MILLETINPNTDVVVYQETQQDREKFIEETEQVYIGDRVHFAMNLYDPTSCYYKYPEYQTWYINKMLKSGYSLVGYSSGFIFAKSKL